MKELKMFPQITEETEENLLNLEDEPKSPYSSTPPLNPSSSSSDSPTETPSSPNHDQNQVPCPIPTITTQDAERAHSHSPPPNIVTEEEYSTPPPRTRMRSLSGGAYRLAPTLPSTGRHRRQSGDDVLTRVSPSRRATLFDNFRPRSKSDSKGKKPTFLASLKHSIFSGVAQRKTSTEEPPLEPLQPHGDYRQRSRSGSETKGGTMSKMIDLFRSRSNSLSIDSRSRVQISFDKTNSLLARQSLGADRRRKKSSGTYRSLDAHQSDLYECHTDDFSSDRIDYESLEEEKVIPTFLSNKTCYNVMPVSGKIIVLYSKLLVRNAFSALVTNDMRAASVYDTATSSFVGMLTITDFINVLRHYYYRSPEDIKAIEDQSIETWKRITTPRPFIQVYPNESLLGAVKKLLSERIHRLPVYDTTRHGIIFILTKRKVLQFLYDTLMSKLGRGIKMPWFMKKSIVDLKSEIGTWHNIATVSLNTTVIEALDLFIQRGVSALPVIDQGRVIDIYRKFDVFKLAKDQTYHNLELTIDEVVDKHGGRKDRNVYACFRDDTLLTVIYKFVAAKVHQLVVINESQTLMGIISLSDVFRFLVLKSSEDSNIKTDVIEEAPEGAVGGAEDSDVFTTSGAESSESTKHSVHLEKQDSSDLSEDFVKLHLEAEGANVLGTPTCKDKSKEDPQD